MINQTWTQRLKAEFDKPYWLELQNFVALERSNYDVFPPEEEVFAALNLTPLASIKVVILGQDPYHNDDQAHGLAFSVRPGQKIPPSLRNIHKELHADTGHKIPDHGSLLPWARQGVLLLNATLTVRAHAAASHQNKGWENFTDALIRTISEDKDGVVFILWGASARAKKRLIDTSKHQIVESVHPSPLSAHRGFFSSAPFSKANAKLAKLGLDPIDWNLNNT